MTLESQGDRGLPVPWSKLKEVADAHSPPRLGIGQLLGLMMGLLLVGLSVVAFGVSIVVSLDPSETVEPAIGLVITCVGLGFTAALIGASLLRNPGSAGKLHS